MGRAGHAVGVQTRGLILAATPAELAGRGRHGPGVEGRDGSSRSGCRSGPARRPLPATDRHGLPAASGRSTTPSPSSASPPRWPTSPVADFDACLSFLAGDLAAPPAAPTSPSRARPRSGPPRGSGSAERPVRDQGARRVIRWFWSNVGTITSEESVRVHVDGQVIGTLEGAYAERLQAGDRFVLDGRALEFRRMDGLGRPRQGVRRRGSEPSPLVERPPGALGRAGPSTSPGSGPRAAEALAEGPSALRAWLGRGPRHRHRRGRGARSPPRRPGAGQRDPRRRRRPGRGILPTRLGRPGLVYAFHAPLGRPASEAMARATAARLGRRFGRT